MYRYYLINRPPDLVGACPAGVIHQETWEPTQSLPMPSSWPSHERQAHGYVDYEQPLSFMTAWKADLFPSPDDLTRWLAYQYWLDGGRDVLEAEFLIRDAWDCDPSALRDPVDLILLQYKQQDGRLGDLLQTLREA